MVLPPVTSNPEFRTFGLQTFNASENLGYSSVLNELIIIIYLSYIALFMTQFHSFHITSTAYQNMFFQLSLTLNSLKLQSENLFNPDFELPKNLQSLLLCCWKALSSDFTVCLVPVLTWFSVIQAGLNNLSHSTTLSKGGRGTKEPLCRSQRRLVTETWLTYSAFP